MKIAIAGFGLEGRSNYEYFKKKFPDAEITIFDENPELSQVPSGVKNALGDGAFERISGFDLVVRTAGLRPDKIKQEENHWSATREFFAECPAPIIGVTGSKGKGTTCSFIVEILKSHFSRTSEQRKVHLLGNIGLPALEILSDIKSNDVVVYEMSSFQLWDLDQSPQVAVMTLIEPDHLDVHTDMNEYVSAKSHIFAYQKSNDLAIYNQQDRIVSDIVERAVKTTQAKPVPFLNKKFVHIEQGKFYYDETEICDSSVVKLPGEHNLRNAGAAISAVWRMTNGDAAAISSGLANFHGLPHRMKLVREVGGVKFYDDSIATTPGSAIAAVKSFQDPKIIIMGGHDKGADYSELGSIIDGADVRKVFAIGANRDKVFDQISSKTDVEIFKIESKNMAEIVSEVYQQAKPGDVVILSPAAASFDMFESYKDRGDQFIAAVNGLC